MEKTIASSQIRGPPPHTGPRHFPTQPDISRPTGNVRNDRKCPEMSGNVGKSDFGILKFFFSGALLGCLFIYLYLA